MSSLFVSTVNVSVSVSTSLERIINRTLLLPVNTPYLTVSLLLFFMLNAYLVWEKHLLQLDFIAGNVSQFESFLFYVISSCACILLIILSASKDIFEENHRLSEAVSFNKIVFAILTWCLLSAFCIPSLELYGNADVQSSITEHHLSVLDFTPKKTPFYSSSW